MCLNNCNLQIFVHTYNLHSPNLIHVATRYFYHSHLWSTEHFCLGNNTTRYQQDIQKQVMSPSQQFFPKFTPQQQFFTTGSTQQNVGFAFANANPQFMQALLKMQQSQQQQQQQRHQNKSSEQNGTTTQFPFIQNPMLQNRMIYQNQQIYLNPAFQQQFLNAQQSIVQQQQNKLRTTPTSTSQRTVSTPPTIAPAANIQQIVRPDYVQRLFAAQQQNGSKLPPTAKKKPIHRPVTTPPPPPPPPPPNAPETRYFIDIYILIKKGQHLLKLMINIKQHFQIINHHFNQNKIFMIDY